MAKLFIAAAFFPLPNKTGLSWLSSNKISVVGIPFLYSVVGFSNFRSFNLSKSSSSKSSHLPLYSLNFFHIIRSRSYFLYSSIRLSILYLNSAKLSCVKSSINSNSAYLQFSNKYLYFGSFLAVLAKQ